MTPSSCSQSTSPGDGGRQGTQGESAHQYPNADKPLRRRLILTGDVQGFGIRPDIARIARCYGLVGFVRNSHAGVELEVQGEESHVLEFLQVLDREIGSAKSWNLDSEDNVRYTSFSIVSSDSRSHPSFALPRDRVTCATCLEEVLDPENRRYGFALNGCAKCGPRYSIMRDTPYDRANTTMLEFTMCSACRGEYEDPDNRRYHAQTNCCPVCGPKLSLRTANNHFGSLDEDKLNSDLRILDFAATCIRQGGIVALKGLGGYQLLCDATNEGSVRRLREHKQRVHKPLAVMVSSIDDANRLAHLSTLEKRELTSSAGPIVLAPGRKNHALAKNVHPGLIDIGLMLPTTAMHHLLLRTIRRPIVVTSGNVDGAPIEYENASAEAELADTVDCFVHHDRPIENPVDDSVVRCTATIAMTLRAARGLAPIQINLQGESALALGGHQKNSIAVSNGSIAFLGPHIGDLDSLATRERFAERCESMRRLLQCRSNFYMTDLHPDYFPSRWAVGDSSPYSNSGRDHALPNGTPQHHTSQLHATQHHFAHVLASWFGASQSHGRCTEAMHTRGSTEVLGFSFDGTGYGSDGTVWGGEVLKARCTDFERVAHIMRFPLLGGDAAVREPQRIALALLERSLEDSGQARHIHEQLRLPPSRLRALQELRHSSLAVETSSMGRLFDGIAAMIDPLEHCDFDGAPAMRLEALCDTQ
jgi:hydrogenase maturation protein HypF